MINLTKKFYITTAIPYVNADPHLGHTLEFVQTDVVKRYHRILGEDAFLTTGADENSLKNVQAAEVKGITTQQLCDENAEKFRKLSKQIGLSFDSFVRSSNKETHWPGVQELWNRCNKKGDIYKKKYKGLYCVGCECFYKETELVDGICPEHNKKTEEIEEENYFFKLTNYQEKLIELIEKDELKIYPEFRKKEVLNFIKDGLEDFSISRSKNRAKKWGVPVPDDKEQIMYVWFDALSCYITGVGFGKNKELFEKYWPAEVHAIGKGITRFHAIYWPAMLLSAGLKLPKSIMIHGYITVEGQKMSKSLGNVLDPFELIKEFGSDQLRYYLLREIPTFQDGDFSKKKLREKINTELVANMGNLVNRTMVFLQKNFDSTFPEVELNEKDKGYLEKQKNKIAEIKGRLDELDVKEGLDRILEFSANTNKYFQDNEPWKVIKEDKERAGSVLGVLANQIKDLAILLWPYIPSSSEAIFEQLGIERKNWDDLGKLSLKGKVGEPEILFKKLEEIKEEKKKVEFSDLDLEVGEIQEVVKHPDAEKLFIEVIKLSDGNRQIISGLVDYYSPDELKGKKVLIIKNLKPAKIRGVLSQGMVLVAEKDGLEVIEPDAEVGTKIKLDKDNKPAKEITIDEFFTVELVAKDGIVYHNGKKLLAGDKEIKTKKIKDGKIR